MATFGCLSIVAFLLLTLLTTGRKCADVSLSDDYQSGEYSSMMDVNGGDMSLSSEGHSLASTTHHIEEGCQLRCEDHVSANSL